MRIFRSGILGVLALGICVGAYGLAQAQTSEDTLEFEGQDWTVRALSADMLQYMGRSALHINQGQVWLETADFSDGVIEFDVAYTMNRGFVGVGFRSNAEHSNYEEFYFRTHLSGQRDAIQYTPVENRNSAWQIFTDANANTKVYQEYDQWNHVKIVVIGDKADLYFNSNTPVTHIDDLKTDLKRGGIHLHSYAGAGMRKSAYFTNFLHRPLTSDDKIVGTSKPVADTPKGSIGRWHVSPPFQEADVQDVTLEDAMIADLAWQVLESETNGIANLSKLGARDSTNNTVFVKTTIHVDEARRVEFKFGYSDRVRLFVNGQFVYGGGAGFRSRDLRFYGTVGTFDTVGLDLQAGENVILAAVSENFGGWAFTGAVEDQTGLTITP
ncbi:MAG: hypothetical protein COA69_00145 [Robiginitomaculum sp.]|nr:MAG: hypothetical protein COA69_00145 [Robiginitomaculum sp.]